MINNVNYDILWSNQSTSSTGSMPLGGFDTGCNVWVENNELYIYVSESGTFDENNTMLKLARLRLKLMDNEELLMSVHFRQQLHLNDGYISIKAGSKEDQLNIMLWCSVSKPELHIECRSTKPHRWQLSFENWRYRPRIITPEESGQCRDICCYFGYDRQAVTKPDTVEPSQESLIFYHRNSASDNIWHKLVKQQHVEKIKELVTDPISNRTMGGILRMDGMAFMGTQLGEYAQTDFEGYLYQSEKASEKQDIVLTLHTAIYNEKQDWYKKLKETADIKVSHEAAIKWWNEYFEKSYIVIDEDHADSEAYRIGRNYQLFNYMLGCNYYGEYPTKFNGGLFTFDGGGESEAQIIGNRTPDYRNWSGGDFTAQNQRLVYWGMLKAGHYEEMRPQLDYYARLTATEKARAKYFFNIDGAYFNEQGNNMGLCNGAEYNWKHSDKIDNGLEDNAWVRLHFSTALEFALMMLEYSRYSKNAIPEYIDYIESVIEFYYQYYHKGTDGKLDIFPASALETYKGNDPFSKDDYEYGTADPADSVSGLRCLIPELIDYMKNHGESRDKIKHFEEYLEMCPELPKGKNEKGEQVYLPARKYNPAPFNCELPELYVVYPYSTYGLDKEQKEIAQKTYRQPYAGTAMYLGYSWHQNGIFAARLGFYDDAWEYLADKLSDSPRRFPTFWGPGHDWTPDHNQGGSGMIALQEMLMQCDKDEIRILPCWDKKTDVSFRLYAPGNRMVECVLKKGRIEKYEVKQL